MNLLVYGGLAALLVLCLVSDARFRIIPNAYSLGGTLYGFGLHAIAGGWEGAAASAAGIAVGFGLMLAVHLFGAVGAGDVKLFAAIGAMTGGTYVLNGVVNSLLFACVIGIAIVLVRKQLVRRLRTAWAMLFSLVVLRNADAVRHGKKQGATFPFMYAVLPAIAWTSTYCKPFI